MKTAYYSLKNAFIYVNINVHISIYLSLYIYIFIYIYNINKLNIGCELLHKKCSILKIELYKAETDK